jgi:hypothetical protein
LLILEIAQDSFEFLVGADSGKGGADFGCALDAFDVHGELASEGAESAKLLFEVVILREGSLEVGCFGLVGDHEASVFEGGFDAIGEGWLAGDGLISEGSLDALEGPWVGDCGPADHDTVAAGFGKHFMGVFWGFDVAVADEGDLENASELLDEFPVGFAVESLFGEAGVEGEHLRSGILESAGEIRGGEEAVFVSRADFYGDGNFDSVDNGFDNFLGVIGVFEEGGSGTSPDDFRHPATHVDVEDVTSEAFGDTSGFGHDFGIATEDLDPEGTLVGVDFHFFVSLDGVVVDGHSAHEFGEHEAGVGDALADYAEGEV